MVLYYLFGCIKFFIETTDDDISESRNESGFRCEEVKNVSAKKRPIKTEINEGITFSVAYELLDVAKWKKRFNARPRKASFQVGI